MKKCPNCGEPTLSLAEKPSLFTINPKVKRLSHYKIRIGFAFGLIPVFISLILFAAFDGSLLALRIGVLAFLGEMAAIGVLILPVVLRKDTIEEAATERK